MALPRTRDEFVEYIKNILGNEYAPVEMSVNNWNYVTDMSISFFREYVQGFSKNVAYGLPVNYGTLEYELPENIYAVTEIMEKESLMNFYTGFPSRDMTPGMHQFWASFGKLGGSQFVDAEIMLENLNMFYQIIIPKTDYEFSYNEHMLRLRKYPVQNTTMYMLVNMFVDVDETGGSTLWGNKFLIEYGTILAELQWSRNVRKFKTDGSLLPGGIQLNFEAIYTEAREKKDKFEEWAMVNLVDPSWHGIAIG